MPNRPDRHDVGGKSGGDLDLAEEGLDGAWTWQVPAEVGVGDGSKQVCSRRRRHRGSRSSEGIWFGSNVGSWHTTW